MRQLLKKFGEFNVSPRIRVEGGHLISLRGSFGVVVSYAAVQE